MHLRRPVWIALLLFVVSLGLAQNNSAPQAAERSAETQWVDSVYNRLTLRGRIGQLLMIEAYPNHTAAHQDEVERLVEVYQVGGVIFLQAIGNGFTRGGPVQQAHLTNRLQKAADVPLMIAQDAEWGLSMRLDSVMTFPHEMTLGAIPNNVCIEDMGREMARQCRRIGIQVSFSPVVDVNVNAKNPVIYDRSFGEDRERVANKGIAYARGLKSGRVLASAKHFPGHGDTDKDSHKSLPVINHKRARLDSIELYPFKRMVEDSVGSIMVAHVHIPALDNRPNRPTTLSEKVVQGILRDEWGYDGLIFTDAMGMAGVAAHFAQPEANLLALQAGVDILLMPQEVPAVMARIEKAIQKGEFTEAELAVRVKRVLREKYRLGLNKLKPVEIKGIHQDLHDPQAQALSWDLYREALTVVTNKNERLPIGALDTLKFGVLTIGLGKDSEFDRMLEKYADFQHISLSRTATASELNAAKAKFDTCNVVVVALGGMNPKDRNRYGISWSVENFLDDYSAEDKVILAVYGNPYSLKFFPKASHLLCAYEENEYTLQLVPQALFGVFGPAGTLPVSAGDVYPAGTGLKLKSLGRLGYSIAEAQGMNSKTLAGIDRIALQAISDSATPGCQILVARNGHVIYNKAFGHYTYDRLEPVSTSTIYDLASVTKVVGTLQAVMFLSDWSELDIYARLGDVLPEAQGTNKARLSLRDILIHEAGLKPYLNFWRRTVDSEEHNQLFYCFGDPDSVRCMPVQPGMYAHQALEDSMVAWVLDTPQLRRNRRTGRYSYKYSDLGYHLLKRIAERKLNQPIDEFLAQNFYKPLGLRNLGYRPLNNHPVDQIAPTAFDPFYRHGQIQGSVHDENAAMLGGVAGHAGLFSNAEDLARLLQMNLNGGSYGGTQFLTQATLEKFTAYQREGNRRGLGWDKPERSRNGGGTGALASDLTFGHTGFTGTCVWVDPKYDLIYVFLSNRVYPNPENRLLVSQDVRTRIHQVIYEAMMDRVAG